MILITMGSRRLKCDRIVNAVLDAKIDDKVIIQGYCTPNEKYKNAEYLGFVDYNKMDELIEKASVVIASGTGSIFRALNKNKKVIIFPRLGRYGEALDDHGLDMKVLKDMGYAEFVEEAKDFKSTYERTIKTKFKKYKSNTKNFIKKLEEELEKL